MSEIIEIAPQPGPQTTLLTTDADDILFGGGRGGGKTFGLALHWVQHAYKYGIDAKGLLIRKVLKEFGPLKDELGALFCGEGQYKNKIAEWEGSRTSLKFSNKAKLVFSQLEKPSDILMYKGHQYSWIGIEEADNYKSPEDIMLLKASLRSANPNVKCCFIMTANPGGMGNGWLRKQYVDRCPAPNQVWEEKDVFNLDGKELTTSIKKIYIPSKITDNPKLLENDPNYLSRIKKSVSGKEWMIKAWIDGDWNVQAGGMFDYAWDKSKHVIPEFIVPQNWSIYRSYDWGYSSPFSVGWWAVSNGESVTVPNVGTVTYPRGSYFRIDEWYGAYEDGSGLQLSNKDFIAQLKERENVIKKRHDKKIIHAGPADSQIFNRLDEDSIADVHKKLGIKWLKAEKGPGSRVAGWQRIIDLLMSAGNRDLDGPGMYVFDRCLKFIEIFPHAQRDPKKQDDIIDEEDHIMDETSYMVRWKPMLLRKLNLQGT